MAANPQPQLGYGYGPEPRPQHSQGGLPTAQQGRQPTVEEEGRPTDQPYAVHQGGPPTAQPYAAHQGKKPPAQLYSSQQGRPPTGQPYAAQQGGQPTAQSYTAQQGGLPTARPYSALQGWQPTALPYAAQHGWQQTALPYAIQQGGQPTAWPYAAQQGGQLTAQPYAAQPYPPAPGSLCKPAFPPGTDPNIVARFEVANQDGSGLIDDKELQRALSYYNHSFSLRTVHLLMYLFTNTNNRKIGPQEFVQVFHSLQNWRAVFESVDRDRSGKIDANELREALSSLGFSVPPVILDMLVAKFDKTGGNNTAIEYDNFIECYLTVKGLTEKFKEKDSTYSGSATYTYENFMLAVLPFLIA